MREAITLIVVLDRLEDKQIVRHAAYIQPKKINWKRKKSKQTGSYIWEVHGTVPLHCVLDLSQAAVVPPRKLETQWPVGRNDRPANELDRTIGHIVNAITVPRQLTNHFYRTDLTRKPSLCIVRKVYSLKKKKNASNYLCFTSRNSCTTCSGVSPKRM